MFSRFPRDKSSAFVGWWQSHAQLTSWTRRRIESEIMWHQRDIPTLIKLNWSQQTIVLLCSETFCQKTTLASLIKETFNSSGDQDLRFAQAHQKHIQITEHLLAYLVALPTPSNWQSNVRYLGNCRRLTMAVNNPGTNQLTACDIWDWAKDMSKVFGWAFEWMLKALRDLLD